MAVKVRIPAPLRGLTGGKGEVDAVPGSVSEVISGLDRSFAGIRSKICEENGEVRKYVRLFLNDEDVRGKGGLKAPVKDGDVLSIIPAIAGGAARPVIQPASGLALVLVTAILSLLLLLATAFVSLASASREISQSGVGTSRALLLARSGVEYAAARLRRFPDPAPYPAPARDDWSFREADPLTSLDRAHNPSWAHGEPYTVELGASNNGRFDPGTDEFSSPLHDRNGNLQHDGWTGRLRGTSQDDGETFSLKVESVEGIHVNGGDPSVPYTGNLSVDGYNQVLRRVLGNLAEAIGAPLTRADGEKLVSLRPGAGWADFDQIMAVALAGRRDKMLALRPYLSLRAWVDAHVIRPNADRNAVGRLYTGWVEILLDHVPGPAGTREPVFEHVNGRRCGRAPVLLAWAKARPVVVEALVRDLEGVTLDEGNLNSTPVIYTDASLADKIGRLVSSSLSRPDAQRIATLLRAYPDPLETWKDWNRFCDSLPFDPVKRDILKANFNPNTNLNKLNPNRSMWRSVDKSDLLTYSIEWTLLPTSGTRISSLGRTYDRGGRLLACRACEAELSGPAIVRLTTQSEFLCEDLASLDRAGDEGAPRLPLEFCATNDGPGVPTWGARLGAAVGGAAPQGVCLQTYPESWVDPDGPVGPRPLSIRPAHCDGSVQLATIETQPNYYYDVGSTPVKRHLMLASFDDQFDLESGTAGTGSLACRLDVMQATAQDLARGSLDGSSGRPSTLYPDGCYSQVGRVPAYLDLDNANGYHGVMSMWVKHHNAYPGPRGFRLVQWTVGTQVGVTVPQSTNQFFGIVFHNRFVTVPMSYGLFFENSRNTADVLTDVLSGTRVCEHGCWTQSRGAEPHRWHLVTAYFDSRARHRDDAGEIRVDDANSLTPGLYCTLEREYPNAAATNVWDIASPFVATDHLLSLGHRAKMFEYGVDRRVGSGADVTIDEFSLFDFGGGDGTGAPASDETLEGAERVAVPRFREGRYYKESVFPSEGETFTTPRGRNRRAAEYFSPRIDLGHSRIRGIAWTQIVPMELCAPADPAPDGGIFLELCNEARTDYLPGPDVRRYTDPAYSRVDMNVDSPFRLHAVFQPNVSDPDHVPVLDPLTLDDITVLYDPTTATRVISWRDVRD